MALKPRRHKKRHKLNAEINVVPYIDVMLVLLVIFMISTPLMKEGVDVELPSAKANKIETSQSQPIVVTVNQDGQYFIDSSKTPVAAPRLVRTLQQKTRNDKRQVYVRGDKHARYGQVVQAMVLIQQAGIAKVGLMTEDSDGRG